MIELAYLNPRLIFQKAAELTPSTRVISLDSYFDSREGGMCGMIMPPESLDTYSKIMIPNHSLGIVTDGDNYGFVAQIVTRRIFKKEGDINEGMFSEGSEQEAGAKAGLLGRLKSFLPGKKGKAGRIVMPYQERYKVECTGESSFSGKTVSFSSEEGDRFGFLISLGSEELNALLLERLGSTQCRLKEWAEYSKKIEGLQSYGLSSREDYAISRVGGEPQLNMENAKSDLTDLLEKSAVFRFIDGGENAFYQRMITFGSRLEKAVNAVIMAKRGEVDGYHIFEISGKHLTKEESESAGKIKYYLADFEGKHFLLPASSEPVGKKTETAPKPPKVRAGVTFKPVSGVGERAEVISSPFDVNIEKSGQGVFGYTPRDIQKFLDKYVVGQEGAKKRIAVAAFKHMTRINDALSDTKSKKSNILMMGDTGTGKTHIAKTLARALELPFAEIDCNTLTEHGYEGSKIEDALVKLYHASGNNAERAQRGIVFLDEFDKLRKQDGGGRDVRGNVQNALLKVVEGDKVSLSKHGCKVELDTSDILFICGGAFASSGNTPGLDEIVAKRLSPEERKRMGFMNHTEEEPKPAVDMAQVYRHTTAEDIIDFGIIPELVGRLTTYVSLDRLNPQVLRRILTEPEDSILKDQVSFFKTHGVELEFTEDALDLISQKAYETGTGARSLKKIIESVMLDFEFDIQDYSGKKLVIDSEKIKKALC